MEQHLAEFERALLRRNFRPNSIRAYLRAARRFLAEANAPLSDLSRKHITDYLDQLTAEGVAAQTRNQIMAALRLFMSEVAGATEATAGVRRAMVPSTVPVILSGTEVQALLKACRTPTHRALIMTLDASGLRVTEACSLRIDDVDSKRMVLRIVGGKTGDRYAPLSPTHPRCSARALSGCQATRPLSLSGTSQEQASHPSCRPPCTRSRSEGRRDHQEDHAPQSAAFVCDSHAGLGAQLGITTTVHTWTRELAFHPHLHCVVTGSGLTSDGRRWKGTTPGYLFPVKTLGALFRGKFLAGLRGLADDNSCGDVIWSELRPVLDRLYKKN